MTARASICSAFVLMVFLVGRLGAEPYREVVRFVHTEDVGFGNEVCVAGDHPDLGNGDPLMAPKLSWSPGNQWFLDVALPQGAAMTYRFVRRPISVSAWCDPASVVELTSPTRLTVPAVPELPWPGKTILYYSDWENVVVLANDLEDGDPNSWFQTAMVRAGPGPAEGLSEHRITLPIPPGHEFEFVFKNADAEEYDNAFPPPNNGSGVGAAPAVPVPYQTLSAPYNYRTSLDVFLVQSGQLYTYRPAASVSPGRIETFTLTSTVSSIPSRTVRVYLPRGYDEHSTKAFPWLLMHDGQNCFFPGGSFGTWDADRIASYETAQGRMRETIIVSLDNSANRIGEYVPSGDSVIGVNGIGADYGDLIEDDLIPELLSRYRLLVNGAGEPRSRDSVIVGSSLGGLISNYLGQEILFQSDGSTPVFGTLGIFSPSYWAAENYVARRNALGKQAQRLFLYMGTSESSGGEASSNVFWGDAVEAYNAFNTDGYALHGELQFEWVCGGQHNEPAWSRQMPAFLQFALPPARDPNTLALELFPPKLALNQLPGDTGFQLQFTALHGFDYELQQNTKLVNPWNSSPLGLAFNQPWQAITLERNFSGHRSFFRVAAFDP
ncbi:alpha/beta hydrolase-fold protein [Haloferula sp.]|uniref:alpha/beta hydrolase-fold protein n=1 Tax=Haloferula sp. TaxID=2497595 RepID=UPI003C74DA87